MTSPKWAAMKTYAPDEWEPMGLLADGSIKIYTPEEWEKLEAALRSRLLPHRILAIRQAVVAKDITLKTAPLTKKLARRAPFSAFDHHRSMAVSVSHPARLV